MAKVELSGSPGKALVEGAYLVSAGNSASSNAKRAIHRMEDTVPIRLNAIAVYPVSLAVFDELLREDTKSARHHSTQYGRVDSVN